MVITISGCLTILAFKISKKLNFDLKIGNLKMLSKNLLALDTLLHLKSDGISLRKWLIWKNEKIHFRVKFWVRVKLSKLSLSPKFSKSWAELTLITRLHPAPHCTQKKSHLKYTQLCLSSYSTNNDKTFKTESTWTKGYVQVFNFWDRVNTIFGPCFA